MSQIKIEEPHLDVSRGTVSKVSAVYREDHLKR